MKRYLFLPLFFCFFQTAFSQDTTKLNNALLLDYYQSQRFDKAVEYLKKTYPEPINDIKILKALAYCTKMDGKLPEAETYYMHIYTIDSTSTPILFNLAGINLARGNARKAEVWYKKIMLRDSTNFFVYKQLAQISLDKSDIPAETAYLGKANQLNPEDADVAADLADIYTKATAYPLAENVLSKALNADAENMVLLESLVKLQYREKRWPETAANGEKLVSMGNTSGQILTEMGIAYYNMNNYPCGIESFGLIDELEQSETSSYYTGACYKALKNYDKAIAYFQKTIDMGISNNINNYYTEIADTYEILKKYKKADAAYQKALQFTLTQLTYYSLANMYETEVKNKKTALFYYKKYLSSNPPKKQHDYVVYAKSRIEFLIKKK